MFTSIRNNATLIVLLVSASYSHAQTTVWLSNNATFADMDLTTAASPGTTGSFDIWIKTDHLYGIFNISLDVMAMGGAIEFTGADIVIGKERFQVQRDPMVLQDGAALTGMWAFAGIGGAFFGTGIGPGVPVDNEYLSAYRFATVHYRVAGLGASGLHLKVGDTGFIWAIEDNVLHLGVNYPVSANVPGSTDTIVDGRIFVVPEPDNLFLLLIGGFFPTSARVTRLA